MCVTTATNGSEISLRPEILPAHDSAVNSSIRVRFYGPFDAHPLIVCLGRSIIFSLGSNPDVGRVNRTYHFIYSVNNTNDEPTPNPVVVAWTPLARECHGIDLSLPESPPNAELGLVGPVSWPVGRGCNQPAPPVDVYGPRYLLPNQYVGIKVSPSDPFAAVTSVIAGGCVTAPPAPPGGSAINCLTVPVGAWRTAGSVTLHDRRDTSLLERVLLAAATSLPH